MLKHHLSLQVTLALASLSLACAETPSADCSTDDACDADEVCVGGSCVAVAEGEGEEGEGEEGEGEEGEGEEGEGEGEGGPDLVFVPPALAPVGTAVEVSWTSTATCTASLGPTPLTSLGATRALLTVPAPVLVDVTVACDDGQSVTAQVQGFATANHSVSIDGVATWTTTPSTVTTECTFDVQPRGTLAPLVTETIAIGSTLVTAVETTDISLTGCRAVDAPESEENVDADFVIEVAALVVRFEVVDVDANVAHAEIEVQGADRCTLFGVEHVRTAPDQRVFAVDLTAADVPANVPTEVRPTCRLAAAPEVNAPSIFVVAGTIDIPADLSFFSNSATRPSVVLGSLNIVGGPFVGSPNLGLLRWVTGNVVVDDAPAASCGSTSFVSFGTEGILGIGNDATASDLLMDAANASNFCAGRANPFLGLQVVKGDLRVDTIANDSGLAFSQLRTSGLIEIDTTNADDLTFPVLETVGAFTIRRTELATRLTAPLLRSVTTFSLGDASVLRDFSLPSLENGVITLFNVDALETLTLPVLATGALDYNGSGSLQLVANIDLGALTNATTITIENAGGLRSVDLSGLTSATSVRLSNNAFSGTSGTFTLATPPAPAVTGFVTITNVRKTTQEAMTAAAAALATGTATVSVTNNRL